MKTTVAIINWNSGGLLKSCVESLFATGPDVKLLIIDNHSNDGSVDFVGKFGDRVQLIGNPSNRGFAGGVNDAFLHSSSTPYVLILNPDVRAVPGSVQLLEELMERHPRAGAIGGYVGKKYLPRNFPTPRSLVLENLGLGASISEGAGYDRASASIFRVDQVAAAALMIRREAYDDVGRFDEQFYPAWYEDVDFCWKLRRRGWEVYFAPQAEFLHDGGYSAAALGPEAFPYSYYRNQARYAEKWFDGAGNLAVRASIVAGMAGRMIGRPASASAYGRVLIGALTGW
jgi:N-acetylglucosaminyl-diphospho-decaprenol L-rhamnosyltransferase